MINQNYELQNELSLQELDEVSGGLPTDTIPAAALGGFTSGVSNLTSQLATDGISGFDSSEFYGAVAGGATAGAAVSLITPF